MKKISKNIKPFLLCTSIVLLIVFSLLVTIEKKALHLEINQNNTNFQDFIFKYGTDIGDGLFSIIMLLFLLFFLNYRKIMIGLVSFLLSGVFCQILKKVIAPRAFRPAKVFDPNVLHFVDGVKINYINSFPSGHTATAFAFFIFLAYIYKKSVFHQIIFSLLACFVGYSRVYLSQHFLIDVFCGAIIGLVSFYIAFILLANSKVKWLNNSFNRFLWKNKKRKIIYKMS